MATNCRQHAKDGMVSTRFTLRARDGCHELRFSDAEPSPCCIHCAETSINIAYRRSSLQGLQQGYTRAGQGGRYTSGGRPSVTCREKGSMAPSDGTSRGEDNEVTAKRVCRGEENVLMPSPSAALDASQYTDGGSRLCGVKVEPPSSTG